MKKTLLAQHLLAHKEVFSQLDDTLLQKVEQAAQEITDCLHKNGKLLLMGNGGSAADAQHIAAEFVGRYRRQRPGLAAIALTTDTSALTAIGNDFGFEQIFVRQLEALARKGDVALLYSTSGESKNMILAAKRAHEIGCRSIALTGARGGGLADVVDLVLAAPSDDTPRIQEVHAFLGHALCEQVDAYFAGDD